LEVRNPVSDTSVQNSREIGKNKEVGRTANVEVLNRERKIELEILVQKKHEAPKQRVSSVIE